MKTHIVLGDKMTKKKVQRILRAGDIDKSYKILASTKVFSEFVEIHTGKEHLLEIGGNDNGVSFRCKSCNTDLIVMAHDQVIEELFSTDEEKFRKSIENKAW